MKKILISTFSMAASVLLAGTLAGQAYSPGTISVGGQEIAIAQNGYVGSFLDYDRALAAQSIIDTGAVASAVNPIDTQDGGNTHLMAHNPGIFSTIADNIHNGAKYVITDFNGVSRVYEFYFVAELPAYVEFDESHPIHKAIFDANGETVTIQYCAYGTGTPQVWIGYLAEDQSMAKAPQAPTPSPEVNQETAQPTQVEVQSESTEPSAEGSKSPQIQIEDIKLMGKAMANATVIPVTTLIIADEIKLGADFEPILNQTIKEAFDGKVQP